MHTEAYICTYCYLFFHKNMLLSTLFCNAVFMPLLICCSFLSLLVHRALILLQLGGGCQLKFQFPEYLQVVCKAIQMIYFMLGELWQSVFFNEFAYFL